MNKTKDVVPMAKKTAHSWNRESSYFLKKLSELQLSELQLSELQLSELQLSELQLSKLQLSELQLSETSFYCFEHS